MRGWPVRNSECGVRSLAANVVTRTTRQGNSALRIPHPPLSHPCSATPISEPAGGRGTRTGGPLAPPAAARVRRAAAVAEGGVSELRERIAAPEGAGVSSLWIEELLLQSMLVVGSPLALVAFGVWREMAGPTAEGGHAAEPLAHEDWQARADRGAAVSREVYGRAYRSEEHTSELQSQ